MPNCTLSDLDIGDKARICGYAAGERAYRNKLLAMGLTPNTEITVIRRAPFGDPIQIQVRNFFLSLRQDEAKLIKLQRIQP